MTHVGFIGLGSQGAPIARRIIDAGLPVMLWARRPESLTQFYDTPAQIASSIAELGAFSDHVGICVLDDTGVKDVCDHLFPAMRPGSCVAIHSTVHPNTCVGLAEVASAHGLLLIDAPVSGGSPGATAGSLTVMMGGDESAVTAAWPILETFGGLIVRVGDVGAGQIAKLINNALMAAHVALAHHALAAGSSLGLDRMALSEIVKVSSGNSFGFEVYARQPSPSAFAHGARLLLKDLRLLDSVLNGEPSFAAFRDVAAPFLEFVLKE